MEGGIFGVVAAHIIHEGDTVHEASGDAYVALHILLSPPQDGPP